MATANPIAGSPDLIAIGRNIAPINAQAGDGQKNHDITNIAIPETKKAVVGFFITFANGFTIKSMA